jgi:hypothetical protein
MPVKDRPVAWIGSSKKDLMALPLEVRKFFGHALDFAQRGERHDAAKVLKGFGGMSLHKEISFETEICDSTWPSHGWLYAEGDAAATTGHGALPADVLAWVQATQPKAWETLTKNHGAQAGNTAAGRCAISWTSAARWTCCATASNCWA